jgi:Bacterial SH3 domain
MNISGVAKVVLGFAIAIALLIGGSVAATLYLVAKLTAMPPKPVFDNTPPAGVQKAATQPTTPAAKPTPKPEEKAESDLEPGAYRARITWKEGLLLRKIQDMSAPGITGIEFNQEVVVLEESDDAKWQRVRINGGQEGWVVGGNTEKITEKTTEKTSEKTSE